MNLVNSLIKDVKNHEVFLGIIFILYLFSNVETPNDISPYITNIFGYSILIILTIIIFINSNPILGILAAVCFFELGRRSYNSHPANVMPSNYYRNNVLENLNNDNKSIISDKSMNITNTKTLEEETINNIAVITTTSNNNNDSSYKPVVSNDNNAFELINLNS